MTTLIEPESAYGLRNIVPDQEQIALFLDFDGTLVEIAPSPEDVKLDRRVAPALEALRNRLGGALALVSGRPIAFLDTMLAPHVFDIAGLHGAQIRVGGELRAQSEAPGSLHEAVRDLVRFANSHVGIIVEDKRVSVALHWRLAPSLQDEALALMRRTAAAMGPGMRLQEGKSVAELVPAGASKGSAIGWLMATHTYAGRQPFEPARALRVDEIPGIVAAYAQAARNAIRAGFDGVQIHGANGYLIDQFLRDSTNHRSDAYGGSIENRARLLIEVTQAVADAIGPGRTAVRLSPNGDANGVIDSNPEALFVYVAQALERIGIAFIEMREARLDGSFAPTEQPPVSPAIRANYGGVLILNGDYTGQEANEAIASGKADAIAFGRPYISNPDFVERVRDGLPLADPLPPPTWYAQTDEGYTDYPRYQAA